MSRGAGRQAGHNPGAASCQTGVSHTKHKVLKWLHNYRVCPVVLGVLGTGGLKQAGTWHVSREEMNIEDGWSASRFRVDGETKSSPAAEVPVLDLKSLHCGRGEGGGGSRQTYPQTNNVSLKWNMKCVTAASFWSIYCCQGRNFLLKMKQIDLKTLFTVKHKTNVWNYRSDTKI